MSTCATCPVLTGECPRCGTYYFVRGDGKRFGIRPAESPTLPGNTSWPVSLTRLPNAFQQQPSPVVIASAKAGIVGWMADANGFVALSCPVKS